MALDKSLRPKRLSEYIGQDKVKENVKIAIEATKGRKEALDHVLLYGPPGLGKTTLAHIIGRDGVNVRITSGPAIERRGDLAAIITNLREATCSSSTKYTVSRAVEEVLYPAMEDFALDIVIGKGPGAKSLRLHLPRFTLIGATTRYAMLSPPLRDSFGVGLPARLLRPAGHEDHCPALRRDSGGPKEMAAQGDRPPFPGHATRRQPPAAPRQGLRPGESQGVITKAVAGGAGHAGGRQDRPGRG